MLEGLIVLMDMISKLVVVVNDNFKIEGILCIMYDLCNCLVNEVFD